MRNAWFQLAIGATLLVGYVPPAAAIPSDDLLNSLQSRGAVNDFAGLLSPAEAAALEERCRLLREQTGAELAVVTLESLRGGNIEDFSNKLFARWGIGQKDKNNGLLLLVAMEDRRSRIEVGYGLEPIIPDVLAARILDHELRPRFRQQQYSEGLTATVNNICELVERGEPADRAALAANGSPLPVVLFLTVFVIVGSLIGGIGLGSRAMALILFGLFFAGVPMAQSMALAWPLAPLLQVPLSLLAILAGRNLALHSPPTGRGGSLPGGTNWTWGDFSSSSGGGFSQGWGGFSGGSSGGGGASRSW